MGDVNRTSTTDGNPLNSKMAKAATIDNFKILRQIGNGAYGEVAAVEKIGGVDDKTLYAMKVMDKRKMSRHLDMVEHEWKLLTTIDHPFFVTMVYSFQTNRKLVFILPLAGGGDMMSKVSRSYMSEKEAHFYLCELVEAVGYLHGKQILHRDIKLENLLISADGHLMLTDYGLSATHVGIDDSISGFSGTRHTMAPEIHLGKSYGQASDWWAVGITYCDFRDGKCIFDDTQGDTSYSDNTVKKRPKLPKEMSPRERGFVLKLLSKDPTVRLGSKGVDEVKTHDMFRNVNWNDVLDKKVMPPFVPTPSQIDKLEFFPTDAINRPLPIFDTKSAPLFWDDVDYTAPHLL